MSGGVAGPAAPGTGPGQAAPGSARTAGAALVAACLRGEPTPRPPVMFLGGPWVGRVSGVPAARLMVDPHLLAEAQTRVHALVGQDAVLAYLDPLYIPEAWGCRVRLLESGALTSGLPLAAVEARSPGIDEGRLPVVVEAVRLLAADRPAGPRAPAAVGTLFEGPLTTLARLVGTELALRLMIRDPASLDRAVARVTEVLGRFALAVFAAGADLVVVADPVGSATMISPAMYRRFVLPALRELIGGLPGPVMLHVCGDASPILEAMAETGAAALSLDQCMDLGRARQVVGDGVTLAGNVDPGSLLIGTAGEVARQTRGVVSAGGGRRHIVMPGCGVPPGAPLENVVAMVRAVTSGGTGLDG